MPAFFPFVEVDPVASPELAAEILARIAADEALAAALAVKQDSESAVTDEELAVEVAALVAVDATLAAAIALKQDAATAATDAELAAEAAARAAADTVLTAAVALKQDASTAATDAELAAEASTRAAADTALTAAVSLKQDAATAATDTELAAEATIRAAADTALTAALDDKADLVGGVVPTNQIPAVALVQVNPVADRPAMLALTAQPGDVAVVAVDVDTKRHTYMLQTSPASTFVNWVEVDGPVAPVSSVNGQIGIVVLGPSDVGAATPADVAAAVGVEAANRITADSAEVTARAAAVSAEAAARAAADALLAPLASPALTGTPTAPTQSAGNNSTRIATTAYADAAVAVETTARGTAVSAEATARSNADALLAPLASPVFTGDPTAPTKTPGDYSTRLATTEYTDTAVAVEVAARADAVSSLDSKTDASLADEAAARAAADALLAPLASPALTGNPTTTTQTAGNNSTRIASTAYVDTACGLLVPKSLFTTKGDIAAASGASTVVRRGVGSDGQFLVADSAATSGLSWRDVPDYGASDWMTSGAIAENIDRAKTEISAAVAMTSGTVRLFPGVKLRAGTTYSAITFVNGPTAAGSTLTHSWGGIALKSNRTLVAVSADNTSATWAVNAKRTFTFGTPYTPTSDVAVYFVLNVTGTTPPAALLGVTGGSALVGTSAGMTQISGTSDTGQTTPIASGATLASLAGGSAASTTTIAYAYLT